MKVSMKRAALWFVALATCAAVGCGGAKKPDGMPELYPTSLTFTVDGKGIEGATITLQPVDPTTNRWVPAGVTDKSGVAEMKTSGEFKGAPSGDYKVVVSAKEEVDYGEFGPPPQDDPVALDEWSHKVDPSQFKRFSPVSSEYSNAESTPLEFTVSTGKNAQSFDLGGSVREEVEQETK